MAKKITDEFKISDAAVSQLAQLVSSEDNEKIKGVRVYVAGSGCSGTQWGMTFADQTNDNDAILESGDLSIYVDPQCLETLDDVESEFVNTPQGPSFSFKNTKAPAACGTCGSAGGGCA